MAIQTTDTALGTRTLKAPKCSDAKRNPKAPENKGMLRESQMWRNYFIPSRNHRNNTFWVPCFIYCQLFLRQLLWNLFSIHVVYFIIIHHHIMYHHRCSLVMPFTKALFCFGVVALGERPPETTARKNAAPVIRSCRLVPLLLDKNISWWFQPIWN